MKSVLRILWFALFSAGSALYANPVADFTVSAKQGCLPLNIKFTNTSTGAVSYLWDFGNGNQSTLKDPSAIYYRPGKFKITLTVTDANGLKSVKTFFPLRVFSNPVAAFTADTVACIGENIRFTDVSVKADTVISQWTWDFGDGSVSALQNPVHKYSSDALYSIGLTVTDAFGCKSLAAKSNYIRIKPSPKADFTLDKTYSCKLPASFKASNTSSGAGTFKWFCSNGSSGNAKDFTAVINSFGNYDIKLVAIGALCTDTVTKQIVAEKPLARFSIVNPTVCVGTKVYFKNSSSPDLSHARYYWNFGDGSTDSTKNPNHTYASDGVYQVTLTYKAGDCTETFTLSLTVYPAPDATVEITDSVGCNAPFKAQFNLNGSDVTGSTWDFGDESNLAYFPKGKPIEHTYLNSGFFKVKITLFNAYGCTATLSPDWRIQINTQTVEIVPKEVAGCLPKPASFKTEESLAEPAVTYEWTFTDTAAKYAGKTVDRTFYRPGNFKVFLRITTAGGCIVEDTADISVGNKYIPSFKITKDHICNKDTVHFINTTADSIKKIVRFNLIVADSMDVTDSAHFIQDSIFHTNRGGRYILKLQAKHFGCVTTSEVQDTVFVHGPYVKFIFKSLNCKNSLISVKPRYAWSNREFLIKDDSTVLDHKMDEIITTYRPSLFKLKAWNDTFGCVDSIIGPWPPIGNLNFHDASYTLNRACAPATATFNHNGSMIWFKWVFPNGDSSLAISPKYTFKEAGSYKVKLIGYYDSAFCMDTNALHINVQGVALKGHVTADGKCIPLNLQLTDSLAGTDNDYHTWTIDGTVIEAKQLTSNYSVNTIPANKDFIEVVHRVQNATGCSTEKIYKIPLNGPKGYYTVQRFSVCDTPVFYFKSFIDSSKSKTPLSIKWNISSGFSSNQQNFSRKFSDMGMHYFTLELKDRDGCSSIYTDSFEVSPNMLQPLFTADPPGSFCPPLLCRFTDKSKTFSSEIVKWEWDFGDGSRSLLQHPQKLYLIPGSYEVSLKITSRSGCTATLKKPAYVLVKGPQGSYDFDRGDACLPHKVQFRGKSPDPSAIMEWDLGDGNVVSGNSFEHTYTRRGRYIPSMILSDTNGCKYTLPPIDTIEVFDHPKAGIKIDGLCLHQPIRVSNLSHSNHDDPYLLEKWYFNGLPKTPGADSAFIPESRGMQSVQLIVENKGKCKDTSSESLKIYAPLLDFKLGQVPLCLGQTLQFKNLSSSDTGIVAYEWDFGDGSVSDEFEPAYKYSRSGEYSVRLIARDKVNCLDTLTKPQIAIVGDTMPPQNIPIRRVSVKSNRENELVFASHPNFDFSRYTVYRLNNGRYNKMADIMSRQDTVFFDGQCNTLDKSYCYKVEVHNLCHVPSDLAGSKEHCTIETKALGAEEANRVLWTPYIGFERIKQYQIWRQDYGLQTAYVLIDSVDGGRLSYTDSMIQCNTRQNYRIKAIESGGFNEYSYSDTASAKPYYTNKTTANYTWRASVDDNKTARIEWLNNARSKWGIKGYLVDKQNADGVYQFRNRYFDAADTVYTDQAVKVQNHSYIYRLRGLDNCNDTTPYGNLAQTILLKTHFDKTSQKPALSWNLYRQWDQETDYYEIERELANGTFEAIGRVAADVSTFIDMQAESNCSPLYNYRVRAVSKPHAGSGNTAFSLSNQARAYPESTLFMPTAFSPNSDKINEVYGPKGQYISKYHLQIFNRWGEKIFETEDCMKAWDGMYKGEMCMQGVYLYVLEAQGADNKKYNLRATFTLLR